MIPTPYLTIKKNCFEFLDILNSQHNDIKFTIEQSTKANIPSFLDVPSKITE